MDRELLLRSIASRNFQSDIGIAGNELRALQACLDGTGPCDPSLWGAKSLEDWGRILKEADSKLTYSEAAMSIGDMVSKSPSLTPGSILDFDAIITTSAMDRDRDVLKSAGAMLDPLAPLLLFHNPEMPCGKLVSKTAQNDRLLSGRFCIFNTTLGRDAAVLVEGGGVRISHGFDPEEFEPLKNGRYIISKFSIYEVSLVPIPANPQAIITAFSRGKLHHPFVKSLAKRMFDERTAMVKGVSFEKKPCGCDGHSESPCTCKSAKPQPGKDKLAAAKLESEDPIRWNKSLSKHFDVANEPVAPASMSYEWASKYLEVAVKNIFDTETFIPSARMGSWLSAYRKTTADYKVVDIRNIGGSYESPPVYESIQLKSNLSETFLIDGTIFYVAREKAPLIVAISPAWGGIRVRAFCQYDQRNLVTDLFAKTWQLAKEQNFLKGEAFSLSGEFIDRDELNWNDVFLTEKNQKPLQRTVLNINAKGANSPNRGIIMMGPPGTGKTLSGRVIKNQANGTFIWISARDFYRSGSFGGFEYAFELAKELSPCILFFEDIDNWIGKETVDLMKTEMDGLASAKSGGVVTILTTNFPENLPEALIDRPGRFHDVLKIDLPNDETRKAMIRKWVSGITDIEVAKAVERTKGYSGAHIYELAQFAKSIVESDELGISQALVKALDKIDEQRDMISHNLLGGSRHSPRKDISMSLETKNPNSAVNTADTAEDTNNDRRRGQGPAQGDHDWHERHAAAEVQDEPLVGVDDFDVGNDAVDSIFAIATGSQTSGGQNYSPDTALANNPGTSGQPGVPTPTSGVPNPAPTNPSTNPGRQGGSNPGILINNLPPKGATAKDIDDAANVNQDMANNNPQFTGTTPTASNRVQVDIPGLKSMAAQVKHSGKEGSMYVHGDSGHVHHVMHTDDMHPSNSHLYHSPDEIAKMYGAVHGVTGVKTAVMKHPSKGSGYKLLHKGGGTSSEAETDGMYSMQADAIVAQLKEIKNHLILAARAPDEMLSKEVREHVKTAGRGIVALLKFSSLNPNNDDMPAVPGNNAQNGSANQFSGVPAVDAQSSSANKFNGTPTENSLNQPSMNAGTTGTVPNVAPKSAKAIPPAGVVNVPSAPSDRPATDPDMGGSIDQTNIPEAVGDGPIRLDVQKWLEGEDSEPQIQEPTNDSEIEFEAMMAANYFDALQPV